MARFKLPKQARLFRKALFAGGRLPIDDEIWKIYHDVVEIYGCAGYTRRQHSNWIHHQRKSLRFKLPQLTIAAKLQDNPFPNVVDVAGWALEIKISEVDAFRIVGELLPEAVKAQARFEHSVRPSGSLLRLAACDILMVVSCKLNHTQLALFAP